MFTELFTMISLGLLINLVLGFALAWLVVDRLASTRGLGDFLGESRTTRRRLVYAALGLVTSVVLVALMTVICWPSLYIPVC